MTQPSRRLPDWLRKNLSSGKNSESTTALLSDLGLNTICESGKCPNKNECFSQNTATFMILGEQCTRNCHYCAVKPGKPTELDSDEPRRVAEAVKRLALEHVVITSVTRDDLSDEGVEHFLKTINAIRSNSPDIIIEILTPDFRRDQAAAIEALAVSDIDIFNHNIEVVERFHPIMRPQGGYRLSLDMLAGIHRKNPDLCIKSGAMLGLGETESEVIGMMKDLRSSGCGMLTLGQYLQPTKNHHPVAEYIHPAEFADHKEKAYQMGFDLVEAGPFVRSSYHAKHSFDKLKQVLSRKHTATA